MIRVTPCFRIRGITTESSDDVREVLHYDSLLNDTNNIAIIIWVGLHLGGGGSNLMWLV